MWLSSFGDELVGVVRKERTVPPLHDEVAQLFQELREDVYHYLLTLGLHPPQAQEAAQEVFLRFYATRMKGETIESPKGWIFRVAHNLGLKIRTRQDQEAPFDAALEQRILSAEADPEHQLLDRERLLRFHRAVENLSTQQRRCLFLRLEGLRYPEIGAVLGISASAVGEFLRRAIVRLREASHG